MVEMYIMLYNKIWKDMFVYLINLSFVYRIWLLLYYICFGFDFVYEYEGLYVVS